jgi:hypothetical protein
MLTNRKSCVRQGALPRSRTNLQSLGRGVVDFGTADGTKSVRPGQSVLLAGGYAGGGTAGSVYKRVAAAASVNLGTEDYSVTANWALQATGANFILLSTANRDIHDAVADPGANTTVDDKIIRTINRAEGLAL